MFNQEMNQGEVVSMLLGYTPLPFEANPALFQSISAPPNAQSMLRQMLQRNPTARPALKDVSPFTLLLLLAHAACTGVVFWIGSGNSSFQDHVILAGSQVSMRTSCAYH